jgi:thiol-disulfide isomerase/thioredoxin
MRITTLVSIFCLAGLTALAADTAIPQNAPAAAETDLLVPTLKAKDAAAAWSELQSAAHTEPPIPESWSVTPPPNSEKIKFFLPFVHAMTGKLKDFYTRFPRDEHAIGARLMEFQYLILPMDWGQTNEAPRLRAAGNELLADPAVTTEQHYQVLWIMANKLGQENSRPYLQEILKGDAPDDMKTAATEQLKKLDTLGKSMDLKFTAVDGRNVDLAALKGKVVLVDFWATWCGPCVGEVPDVKKTYDALHGKGFEIVGISLDKEKDKLTGFTAEHQMAWPQYFDGLYWKNKYARQFGIDSIPAMWLVDKKGKVRSVDAREDLSGEVQKLLAE